jgi:hypothetical protein
MIHAGVLFSVVETENKAVVPSQRPVPEITITVLGGE